MIKASLITKSLLFYSAKLKKRLNELSVFNFRIFKINTVCVKILDFHKSNCK